MELEKIVANTVLLKAREAPRRVLQGRAGHRAVLHGQGRQPGPSRQRLLRQVRHRQRLHPLAERDDRDRVLQGPQRVWTRRDPLPRPGLEAAARAPQAQPPAEALPTPPARLHHRHHPPCSPPAAMTSHPPAANSPGRAPAPAPS